MGLKVTTKQRATVTYNLTRGDLIQMARAKAEAEGHVGSLVEFRVEAESDQDPHADRRESIWNMDGTGSVTVTLVIESDSPKMVAG